ncbi:hypothetical protein LCGC14_2637230 [marine sediment metagenome]|uniref:Uncharacterized protein n=1 Tax=marine sediment metagenome TaxID=412755 RepID=A0A0F8ZYG0_9ZZZZ
MTTRIKDLKSMAAGTEIKGMPLMIKTARKPFTDAEGTTYQEVVFMDATGEMTGHILLEMGESEFILWKSKTNICIMDGILQDTDERKKEGIKLLVYECFDTATPLTYDQNQDLQAEDWKRLRQDEIAGKIRHGICCSLIQRIRIEGRINILPDKQMKDDINELADFILTGE